MQPAYAALVVLCLALLALVAVLQVAHVHADGSDTDHCPVCVVLHAPAVVSPAVAAIVLVQIGQPTLVREARAIVRPWHPSLFIRPPPVR